MIAIHPAVILLTLLRGFNMDVHTLWKRETKWKVDEWTDLNNMQNDSSDDENKNNLLKTFQIQLVKRKRRRKDLI